MNTKIDANYDDNNFASLTDNDLVKQMIWCDRECPSQANSLLFSKPEFLQKLVKDKVVCDLGCGIEPDGAINAVKSLGASKYVGVDPIWVEDHNHDNIEFKKTDALTHLRNQSDDSSVIMANWIFNEPVGVPSNPEQSEYLKRVMGQIHRVTPNVCFGFGITSAAISAAKKAGLDVYHFSKYMKFDEFNPKDYPEEILGIFGMSREEMNQLTNDELFKSHGIFSSLQKMRDFFVLQKKQSQSPLRTEDAKTSISRLMQEK
ncbi:MAG: hypothetical protein O2794_04365 [bacterium]|nr:hypothetical protein [bacterium]